MDPFKKLMQGAKIDRKRLFGEEPVEDPVYNAEGVEVTVMGKSIKGFAADTPIIFTISEWSIDDFDDDGCELLYPCVICEEPCPIKCEIHEFDDDAHYCGGSPSCCP